MNDPRKPLKVLLVEDSPILADRLREMIDQLSDIELVDTVDNEKSAVQAATSGGVDAVILDLHLKQGTGFGVLRSIKAATPTPTPVVVVLTNYALAQYQREARLLGARYFLDKAREFERIPEVLQEIAQLETSH
ncbi:MAG TPA: response regulator [Steroidobacteraceae bacterium]|nr:response regulator [Steroidobacteraceae bacterium]